jgi:hypothetical protein
MTQQVVGLVRVAITVASLLWSGADSALAGATMPPAAMHRAFPSIET